MLLVNNNILGFSYLFCCCLISGDGTLSVLNIRRQSVQERSDHLDGELLSVAVVKVIWSSCYSSTSTISLTPRYLNLAVNQPRGCLWESWRHSLFDESRTVLDPCSIPLFPQQLAGVALALDLKNIVLQWALYTWAIKVKKNHKFARSCLNFSRLLRSISRELKQGQRQQQRRRQKTIIWLVKWGKIIVVHVRDAL